MKHRGLSTKLATVGIAAALGLGAIACEVDDTNGTMDDGGMDDLGDDGLDG